MRTKKDMADMLAEHEFLEGLDPGHIDKLSEFSSLKVYHADDFLFRTGDECDCCYLIRNGLVALEVYHPARGAMAVQTLGDGKVLGWSWLTAPYTWNFDGRALTLTRGICIDARRLRETCEQDHEFGYQMLRRFTEVFADRLNATRLQLLDLYGVQK